MVENAVRFDTISIQRTAHWNNDSSKPSCCISIEFVYPDSANVRILNRLQNVFISKLLDDSFVGLPPQQAMEEYAQLYIQNFHQIDTNQKDTIEGIALHEDETGYLYHQDLKTKVVFNADSLISFLVETNDYKGGSYSNPAVKAYVFNLKTNDFVQENQFAGQNYEANLSKLLTGKIAVSDDIKEDEIVPNNNFTIDDKGLTYYFNEEDGVFSASTKSIFIPYNELSIYITSDSPLSPFIE
jgi:hypothetical protein